METETETEMGMGFEALLKRDHKVEVQGQEETAKKRRIELDAEEGKRLAEAEADAQFHSWGEVDEELVTDYYAFQARQYRKFWNSIYDPKGLYGSFEHDTTICAKRFTDEPAPRGGSPFSALQIFSVKVTGLRGDLQWPLDVYGMVAMRDQLDHKRNIIYQRKRNNCQTLNQEDPSLVLTGPTRAVMYGDPVIFEVELKVKDTIESEDKVLSFLATRFRSNAIYPDSCLVKKDYTSKLSTLQLTVGHIFYCVEATISVKVIEGSWRDDFHGQFAASTASIKDEEFVLLDLGYVKVPLDSANISLSRSVVCVELEGELIVSVKARQGDEAKVEAPEDDEVFAPVEDRAFFEPLEMGRSHGKLDVGFCKMEVTVAWSLYSSLC